MPDLTLGLLLALVSTLSTAFAHAYLKAGRDKLAVQAWVRLTGLAVAVPVASRVGPPPSHMIGWIVGAAAIHAVYQLALTWSYGVSEFSVAYPIARGATPLATALLGIVVLGDRPGPWLFAGIATVSAGLLLLARRGGISRAGLIAAGATALLTTAYTLVDARGVRIAPRPLVFIAWFYLADGVSMPAALLLRERRRTLVALRGEWRTGVKAGVMALLAFVPALFAFDLAPAAAVSALRECSVLIGLVLARAMLNERLDRQRVTVPLSSWPVVSRSWLERCEKDEPAEA